MLGRLSPHSNSRSTAHSTSSILIWTRWNCEFHGISRAQVFPQGRQKNKAERGTCGERPPSKSLDKHHRFEQTCLQGDDSIRNKSNPKKSRIKGIQFNDTLPARRVLRCRACRVALKNLVHSDNSPSGPRTISCASNGPSQNSSHVDRKYETAFLPPSEAR